MNLKRTQKKQLDIKFTSLHCLEVFCPCSTSTGRDFDDAHKKFDSGYFINHRGLLKIYLNNKSIEFHKEL